MAVGETLVAPDVDRIAIGDNNATADAISLLWQKLLEETVFRIQADAQRAIKPEQDWITMSMTLRGARDNALVSSHRVVASVVRAYLTSNKSINNATFTKVQMDSVDIDYFSEFDSSANFRFTPKREGKWFCSCSSLLDNISGRAIIAFYKNGAAVRYGGDTPDAAGEDCFPACVDEIEMNGSTDYLEVFIFHESGAARTQEGGTDKTWATFVHLGV